MSVAAIKPKNTIESAREIVQDFLVPELKSIKVMIESLHTEVRLRDEKQTQAIKHLDEKFTDSIKHLDEKLTDSVKHLDEKLTDSTRRLSEDIKQLSDKFDSSVEFRERLAALEAKSDRN